MWELVSFIQARLRRVCLEELSKGQKTPSMIAKRTGDHLTHVSRALVELSEKELVRCLTPDTTKNRFYEITEKGSEILQKLRELE